MMNDKEALALIKKQFNENLKEGLINLQIDWLIKQAEKVESLQKKLDAKIVLINNGWEEERYILQDKVERLEKRLEELAQSNYCIICGDNATEVREGHFYCEECCK